MARRRPASVHGLVVIDKPTGCTSHDVVDRVRRVIGERRVGHSGTLDPDASGLLLVGVGQATRLLRFLDVVHLDTGTTTYKEYTGTVVLGVETDTLDASGTETARHDMSSTVSSMSVQSIQDLVNSHLVGAIEQVPPMVSALRVDGQRLHELARQGVEVERKPRPITVHLFDVTAVREHLIDIRVGCSSGTYIRTLAADLGRLMGGGAHLRDLRRVKVGAFGLEDSVALQDFETFDRERARKSLLPIVECCRGLSHVEMPEEQVPAIAVGGVLPRYLFTGEPPWAAVHSGAHGAAELLAVYEPFANDRVGDDMARPAVVLVSPPTQPAPE